MFGVRKIGDVLYKSSAEIKNSRIGLGLEKLDRDLYDPTPCYDKIAELGVKWIRIQSGWCRTEKTKGSYDFSWLDIIVDNLLKRGLTPWMCLCYGNGLYTPDANNKYGAVGRPPIKTETERLAWDNYIKACVAHYKGRVNYYEVWNEPDGNFCWRTGVSAKEYSEFAERTAKAAKSVDQNAKIIAGAFHAEQVFINDVLKSGCADFIDYVSYHRYKYMPDNGVCKFVDNTKAIIKLYSDKIGLIQGETGTQSQYSPNGALPRSNWTERKQTKYLLRKIMIDLATDIFFTSYFTAVDIYENIHTDTGEKTKSMYGFFGLLGENFDESGTPLGTYFEKESYRAFKTLCAVMSGNVKKVDLPMYFTSSYSSFVGREDERGQDDFGGIYSFGFEKESGAKALVYWKGSEILTSDFESTVSFNAFGLNNDVKMIDLYDGSVYEIGNDILKKDDGKLFFEHIAVKDYPLMITFGDFVDINKK